MSAHVRLFLACSILALTLCHCAANRAILRCNDELRVETHAGETIEGRLRESDGDSLSLGYPKRGGLLTRTPGSSHMFAASDVRVMYRIKRSSLIGLLRGSKANRLDEVQLEALPCCLQFAPTPCPDALQELVSRELRRNRARSALDGWAVEGTYHLVAAVHESSDDVVQGPSVCAARLHPGGIGFEFGITYILPAGFYDFTGLAADVAITYGLGIRHGSLLVLKAGAVGAFGGNSDGSAGGDVAAGPGIGLVQGLGGRLAAFAEISVRFWLLQEGLRSTGGKLGLLYML